MSTTTWTPPTLAEQVRGLARAYAELNRERGVRYPVASAEAMADREQLVLMTLEGGELHTARSLAEKLAEVMEMDIDDEVEAKRLRDLARVSLTRCVADRTAQIRGASKTPGRYGFLYGITAAGRRFLTGCAPLAGNPFEKGYKPKTKKGA